MPCDYYITRHNPCQELANTCRQSTCPNSSRSLAIIFFSKREIYDCEMPILANAPFLRRVVDNIVSNIRKYADKTEPILVSMRRENGRFVFESINTVGEKKGNAESSGIGLKSCERILESHGGTFVSEMRGDAFAVLLSIPISEAEGENSDGQTGSYDRALDE